jgi:hypothetical protein
MLSVALLSLLVPATGTASLPATAALEQQDNLPVTIWLNKRDVQLGDRVKAYARTNADGYLVVLHAEPDGRVRVLFPLDPGDDNFVRAGNDYEIRDRGGREAFRVYSPSGLGTVYAAFSRDPFVFEPFSRANHWDYGLPDTWLVIEDPEAELTDIAVTMASGAYFDYDLVQYGVGETVAPAPGRVSLSFYGGSYAPYGWGWYDPFYHYGYGYGYPHYGWGFNIGFGWGYPYYYGYYPYYYGYYPYYYPYYYSYYPYRYGYYPCCYYGGSYPSPYYSYPTYGSRRSRYLPATSPYNGASRTRRVYTAGHATSPARRVALASGVSATGRSASAAGRRTSGTIVRAVDAPGRRTVSTSTRNADASTRRSFPQPPVRTTPVRRTDPSTAGRREVAVGTSSTRTTDQARSEGSAATTRRTPTPSRAQVSPVRTTDVRRQITSTRRTTSSANRSVTTTRPTSTRSVSPRTSSPSVTRRVTPTVRRTTPTVSRPRPATSTVRRPSTPARTPARVSRPAAPSRRPTPSVSRSSGTTSSSTASSSKPTRRRKP